MAYSKISDRRAASKRNYVENKKLYIKKAKERKERIYNEIIVPAKSVPCSDCKNLFPIVCMDFDHERGEKKFNISSHYDKVPLLVLKDEISKCSVVCANCHRIRTAKRILSGRLV